MIVTNVLLMDALSVIMGIIYTKDIVKILVQLVLYQSMEYVALIHVSSITSPPPMVTL